MTKQADTMPPVRAQNAKRNLFATGLNKVVALLLPYFVRVVMIRKLGAEYLGLDSLFISILDVLNLSELGFSQAVMVSMYKPIASHDTKLLSAIYAYFRRVYRIVGCVILGAGLAIMPFLPLLIKTGYPAGVNLYILYLIFLINTAGSYFLFAYKQTLISAYQRQDVVSNVNTVARAVTYLLQIALLSATRNYYYYAVAMLVLPLITNIGNSVCADRMYPEIVCVGEISKELRADIRTKVKGLMVNKLCGVSRNSFDSIFISAFVGLTATAMYNNYYYILHALVRIADVFKKSVVAGVGDSVATESKEKNYADMKRLNFLYMWVFGWATACAVCLYQRFISFSFGEKMMLPVGIMVLFGVYFYVLMMGDVRSLYVEATGLWWEQRYRAIMEAVANLVLNYVLGKRFGVYGILIATLLSLFVINFLWGSNIIFKHYFTQTTAAEYFKLHGFYAVITVAACVVTYFVTTRVVAALGLNGIPAMLVISVICIVLPNIIYMTAYRRTKIYKESFAWLGRVTGWDKLRAWKVLGTLDS